MAYNKRVWGSDEVITKEALNNIENGIEAVEQSIPKKTSQLENDSGFITEHLDLSNYAEKDELHEHKNKDILDGINLVRMQAWDNAANKNDIDLEPYALKDDLHEHTNFDVLEHIDQDKINAWDSYKSFSGDYNDLENTPAIPKKLSELENDANFLTEHQSLKDYALKSEIPVIPELPTKVSELENDSGYLTEESMPLPIIPSNLSELHNDTNFITLEDVPACLITEEEKEAMNNRVKALEEVEHVSLEQYNVLLERVKQLEKALAGSSPSEPEEEIPEDPENPTVIPCTSISLNSDNYTFDSIGGSYQLITTVTPSNTTESISYISSNQAVSKVSNKGLITSIGSGNCTITATCGSCSDTININVNASESGDTLTAIYMDKDLEITSKNYYRICVSPIPATITNYTIYWSVDDASVVGLSATSTTDRGDQTLIPGKNGTATLTVSFDAGTLGYIREKYTVKVNLEDTTENVDILYDNPTIAMEGVKAKATKDGVTQYFDVSYEENTGHPSYNSSKSLTDSEGNTYYLALTNKGTSPFGINGLHLDSGAWFTEASSTSGSMYNMKQSVLQWNNFDMNLTIQNLNNSMPSELLEKALSMYNQTLPSLNMTIDSTSKNTIELGSWDDAVLGYCGKYSDSLNFYIHIDETVATEDYGAYTANNNKWLSTVVHELGHTLGTADNAAHLPSMYHYGRDKDRCVYLQPNDIAWIEYLHKEQYGVDITTTQEDINSQILNLPSTASIAFDEHNFEYMHYDDVTAGSDVVVECQLKYNKTEFIDISNSFKLEYNVYDIINEVELKGDLINKQLKIHVSHDLDIDENCKYKLYLKQYNSVPCSLINPYQGIEKL
jgi:hypothetical protein